MNFEQLKTVYPEAILTDQPFSDKKWLSYSFQNKWLHIHRKNKTDSELVLLKLALSENQNGEKQYQQSEWYSFLFEFYPVPSVSTNCRIIQFELLKKDTDFDEQLWLHSFKNLFENTVDAFFISNDYGLLIQPYQKNHWSIEELAGIIQTLDDDFSIRTTCYAGQFWPVTSELPQIFKEEQAIFHHEKDKGKPFITLSNSGIGYYTHDIVTVSPIMQNLKKLIFTDSETKELIEAMWQSQGNISLAAKTLFVHRNTLQYRIDRLQETTCISLRNLNDLLLCHLLIIE